MSGNTLVSNENADSTSLYKLRIFKSNFRKEIVTIGAKNSLSMGLVCSASFVDKNKSEAQFY